MNPFSGPFCFSTCLSCTAASFFLHTEFQAMTRVHPSHWRMILDRQHLSLTSMEEYTHSAVSSK